MAATDQKDNQDDVDDTPVGTTLTTKTPIVIDNGGGQLKAGVSGTENPYIVKSLVGTPKHARVMLQTPSTDKFFGENAFKSRGLCKLSHPIQHGIIKNWNDIIQLWQYLYNDVLQLNMNEHPVLITEEPLNPQSNRLRITHIYFEYFNVPSIYLVPPPILALYTTGRLSGCMLDSGHGVTSCVPIIDGYSLPHAITRMNIGGQDITNYLRDILNKSINNYKFRTSSELQKIRIIKEEYALFEDNSPDITYQNTGINVKSGNLMGLGSKLGALTGAIGLGSGLGSSLLGLSKSSPSLSSHGSFGNNNNNNNIDSPTVILPDGCHINIGNTYRRCCEILFNPSIIGNDSSSGIHNLILNTISKCNMNVRPRLYSSIYLCGGNTNIKNYKNRLFNELKKNIHSKKINKIIKIKSNNSSNNKLNKIGYHLLPFIGGSLLSQQTQFRDMWINKDEFNEYGASILYRKSLC